MILSEQVPVIVAMGSGAFGLAAGAVLATAIARDKLRMSRRLMKIAVQYEAEADRTYANIRALTEPTGPIPTIELFPPTLPARIHRALAEAVERFTIRTAPPLPDWAEGEMTRAFARAEQERETVPATPYVGPGVSRGRQRSESGRAVLPARMRQWGPRLVHHLDGPVRMPERFGTLQLPAQRKPTPLVMASLPQDPTRAYRTKVVPA